MKRWESLWTILRADIERLKEDDGSFRCLVRGLCSQGFHALLVYRLFRWCWERGIPTQPLRFFVERAIEIATGIQIPAEARIGKGLRIHHFGGIILHNSVQLGEHCTIFHGVTLGETRSMGGAPRVGNDVVMGAGAKILGRIELGDGCRVGANAVVLTSVPPGYVAVGVPAKLKPRKNSAPAGRADDDRAPAGIGRGGTTCSTPA